MPRPIGKDLPAEIINLVMQKHRDGEPTAKIARELHMKYNTVYCIVRRGGLGRPRKIVAGRPRLIDPATERRIVRDARKTPDSFAWELAKENFLSVSPVTIRRCLARCGLKNRQKWRRPALNRGQRAARLAFALKYKDKPISFWKQILWSDESMVETVKAQRRRVYRSVGRQLDPNMLLGTRKGSASSVMVWGCMSAAGTGNLHHIQSNMKAADYIPILDANLLQSKRKLRLTRDWQFMHDNAPAHTARVTTAWLQQARVRTLKWPANSPDMNPIEHLWIVLKRNLSGLGRAPKSQLFAKAKEAWDLITVAECRRLVESMPRRLAAVIKARGWPTKY